MKRKNKISNPSAEFYGMSDDYQKNRDSFGYINPGNTIRIYGGVREFSCEFLFSIMLFKVLSIKSRSTLRYFVGDARW